MKNKIFKFNLLFVVCCFLLISKRAFAAGSQHPIVGQCISSGKLEGYYTSCATGTAFCCALGCPPCPPIQ